MRVQDRISLAYRQRSCVGNRDDTLHVEGVSDTPHIGIVFIVADWYSGGCSHRLLLANLHDRREHLIWPEY